MAYIADYQAMLNRKQEALRTIARALKLAPKDAEVKFRAAVAYSHCGETTKSLDMLAQAVAAGYSLTTIRDTPDFDSLRHETRFQRAIRKP